jgi:hypothetical protein
VLTLSLERTRARTSGKSQVGFTLNFRSRFPTQQDARKSTRLFVNPVVVKGKSFLPILSSSHASCLRLMTRATVPLFNQHQNLPVVRRSACTVPSSVASGFL